MFYPGGDRGINLEGKGEGVRVRVRATITKPHQTK